MKLWKSKKTIGCVPGKSNVLKNEEMADVASIPLAPMLSDRAMSPAQSEDSGLAPERGTTYATITLPRDNTQNMGITLLERNDLSYPPIISALSPLGHAVDFLAPGDRIHQIDGISTIGLTNQQIMNMLIGVFEDNNNYNGHNAAAAIVEIEYSLPDYSANPNSLCVTSKLAQITVERESGCLGLTLRGGGDYPLVVTHVRPHGPVYKTGRIKPGDRLLRVDNVSLIGKTLAEAQQIIKCGGHITGFANLTIEYDVSVMHNIEFSMGPLLIEIERPMNDKLGLVLCNYSSAAATYQHDPVKRDEITVQGIYIASILPASIADRCGALSIGDQVLTIDDTAIDNGNYSPDEVMTMLDANNGRCYTQMQIMPAHALARRALNAVSSPRYGFSTLESRKSRQQQQRFVRKSSLPLENNNGGCQGSTSSGTSAGVSSSSSVSVPESKTSYLAPTLAANNNANTLHHATNMSICRTETFSLLLNCSAGSGILLTSDVNGARERVIIAKIMPDSAADHTGCLQLGDRILNINKMHHLNMPVMQELLDERDKRRQYNLHDWLELEIEFDIPSAVVPSSGVFDVKLLRAGKIGLGLSVSEANQSGLIITNVKSGGPAHRIGSLRAGDVILAVNGNPVQHFTIDMLLKEDNINDFITLTIRRITLPDFLFEAQQRAPHSPIYSNCVPAIAENDIYSNAVVAAPLTYKDRLITQPDYLHALSAVNELQLPSNTSTMARSLNTHSNTHSLTVDLPNEDHQYNDFSAYDFDQCGNMDHVILPPPMESKVYGSAASSRSSSSKGTGSGSSLHQIIFSVRLEPKGGLLGITLAGSEDISKSITISGIVEGGMAHKNGQLQVGDQLLAINGQTLQSMALSHATSILQNLGDIVELKVLRSHDMSNNLNNGLANAQLGNMPQAQAIYAKVQRRGRSPSCGTTSCDTATVGNECKQRTFHVTLYKDKVYDDYGFSVSDGLYERGVYINRIRTGGPADACGQLKPFDRIMQVNEMKTQDFDCCLTVPLIAAAGDKIELLIQRQE